MGELKNGWLANVGLALCLVLFAYLSIVELSAQLGW
jgi:hypothetical protein